MVGVAFVREDVDEEFSGGFEEGMDFSEEDGIVLHVFEPWNGEGRGGSENEKRE